jgi:lipoprotein-anchoring transpeptidase ErfK/SrfK
MPPVASPSVARRPSTTLSGLAADAFLGVVALAVFVGALAFQRGLPTAKVVSTRPVADVPRPPAKTTANPYVSTVAEAIVSKVGIYSSAGDPQPNRTLDNPQPSGAPLVFLVKQLGTDWINVYLPVRPNGSTGWLKRSDVKLSQHDWRLVVETGAHRITAYQGVTIFLQEPIAVGKQDTPTPGGVYYIKELLRPPNPNTVYGPFAYGLSGYSNVLTTFNGGEGVIGIHGNNDASVLGTDVSHGCIRMSNPGISKLVSVLPLGVPVEIRA